MPQHCDTSDGAPTRPDERAVPESEWGTVRQDSRDRAYVSPLLFGAVLAVMLGDVVTTGVGLHLGLQEGNPLMAAAIAWFGLPGMVATKAVAAGMLLVLPAFTSESRWAFQIGSVAYLGVGLLVVVSNVVNIWLIVG